MRITKATHEAAKYACINFHYSRSIPSTRFAYNIYNDKNEWCGVIIYGQGAAPHIADTFGLAQGEVLELCRVALNGKQETTSQAVSLSLKQLHKDAPQVKIVVSYADIDQEHKGIIYQATNWIYLGEYTVGDKTKYFIIHGERVHNRTIQGQCPPPWNLENIRKYVDPNAKEYITKGKHKYIYCFDKWERKKWLPKALPYPK